MNQTLVDKSGEAAMYGGAAATGIMWGLSVSDLAVILSMIVAVLGFIVHAWATIRKDKRELEMHQATMAIAKATGAEVHLVHKQTTRIEDKLD